MSLALVMPFIDNTKGDYFILYFILFSLMTVVISVNYSRYQMNKYLVLDSFPGFRSLKKHTFACLEMKRSVYQYVPWDMNVMGKMS